MVLSRGVLLVMPARKRTVAGVVAPERLGGVEVAPKLASVTGGSSAGTGGRAECEGLILVGRFGGGCWRRASSEYFCFLSELVSGLGRRFEV